VSTIKIEDVAFVRFSVPDLAKMRDSPRSSVVIATADERRVVSRGLGVSPVEHIAAKGNPAFAALGFRAASLADLRFLAEAEGIEIGPFDLPGGGCRVLLRDPDGHRVEVVVGQTPTASLPLPGRETLNSALDRRRLRQTKRLAAGPAHVVRLGHAVLSVASFRTSEAWYRERFGFITSEEITAEPALSVGAFLRCDRGDTPTHHHTLFLLQVPKGPGFNHAAFDVFDLMLGQQRLQRPGVRRSGASDATSWAATTH